MKESAYCDEEDEPIGRVDGKYDFIMMVGDGSVYGFEGERIDFLPIEDESKPIGFQWKPAKNRDVDFDWLPIDDEYDYDDDGYDDEEEDWVPFEDMDDIYDDEVKYDDDDEDWL